MSIISTNLMSDPFIDRTTGLSSISNLVVNDSFQVQNISTTEITVTQNQTIGGNCEIGGNINCSGSISTHGIFSYEDIHIENGKNLYVEGSISSQNDITIADGKDLTIGNDCTVKNDLQVFGDVHIDGIITVNGELPAGPPGPIGPQGIGIDAVSYDEAKGELSISMDDEKNTSYGPFLVKGPKGDQGTGIDLVTYDEAKGELSISMDDEKNTSYGPFLIKGENGAQGPEGPVGPVGPAGPVSTFTDKVFMGNTAGSIDQSTSTIAIGEGAGEVKQSERCIAIGRSSGKYNQGTSGTSTQSILSFNRQSNIAQLNFATAHNLIQGELFRISNLEATLNNDFTPGGLSEWIVREVLSATSFTFDSTGNNITQQNTSTGFITKYTKAANARSIAIGWGSARDGQREEAIAIGGLAGYNQQKRNGIAIGTQAGYSNQEQNSVAIGITAGNLNQGASSVAIGVAGVNNQSYYSTAIGLYAGHTNQSHNSIAIGTDSGNSNQGNNSISIGSSAGNANQGNDCIAIGRLAGTSAQPINSIILNARGSTLNATTGNACYIAPIRETPSSITNASLLFYNNSTSEVGKVRMYVGYFNPNSSIGANQTAKYSFTYGTSFPSESNGIPYIFATVNDTQENQGGDVLIASCCNVTKTGFTIRLKNTSNFTVNGNWQWNTLYVNVFILANAFY